MNIICNLTNKIKGLILSAALFIAAVFPAIAQAEGQGFSVEIEHECNKISYYQDALKKYKHEVLSAYSFINSNGKKMQDHVIFYKSKGETRLLVLRELVEDANACVMTEVVVASEGV